MHTINALFSPESIAFQNDKFFKSLIAIIEQYRGNNSSQSKTDFEIALVKCIKDRTEIPFDIEIGDYPMMTEPPKIDKNSPMLEGYGWKDSTLSKQGLSDIRKSSAKEVVALLDPSSSRVGGYLANITPIRMYLNAPMIYGNKGLIYKLFDGREYSSGEIAAIILHEIGHIWAFFDFLIRFRTTNQILSTMMRQLDGTETHEAREIILRETSDALELKTVDAQELSHKNNSTVYTVIVSNIARLNRSQSGTPGYDINSFEALSDQFAERHGAGRDLVTGLHKLQEGTIYRRGWAGYLFMEAVKIALLALGVLEAGTGQIGAAWYTFAILLGLIFADSHHDWYDKTGYRFKRIKMQLIEELKNPATSKEDSARIRDDIDAIDKINESYKDHTQLVGLVYNYLIPGGVNKRKQIEFQQRLEEMSATKLFYYANQLKHA